MGEVDSAIADLDKAISLDPKSPSGYLIRAFLWQSRSNFDAGLRYITEALWLAPDNASAYGMRALFFADKEDFGRAIADFTQAIHLEPKNWRFHAGRAEAYRIEGESDSLLHYKNAFDDGAMLIRWRNSTMPAGSCGG